MMKSYSVCAFLVLHFFLWNALSLCGQQDQNTTQRIVIYGDTRTQYSVHYRIMSGILSTKAEYVFNTGDLVYDGDNEDDWRKFIRVIRRLPPQVKYYPAAGNHEKESPKYYQHFSDLPGRKKWYCVDTEYIRFICLNTNVRIDPGSEQYRWIREVLKSNTRDYLLVILHTPIVTTGQHEPNKDCFHLLPLFKTYKVGAVFAGHNHNYERCLMDNVLHITTGGGGAPLYPQKVPAAYSQKFISEYHYCFLQSTKKALNCFVFDINYSIIDKFKIPRALK